MNKVCDWPVLYPACSETKVIDWLEVGGDSELEETSVKPPEEFEQMAIQLLWAWTGRVFSTCEVKARPGVVSQCEGLQGSTFWGLTQPGEGYPSRDGWGVALSGLSHWVRSLCGVCGENVCRCHGGASVIALPGPVNRVVEVTIDGEVLAPENYKVTAHRWLTRTDGKVWPQGQDYSKSEGEGTFIVSYLRGVPVPAGGKIAAGALAVQLEKAACAADDCALPQRAQSVTRQGVTVEILDEFEDTLKGRTGIWLVDNWVASVTQPRKASGGRVYSVDVK